MAGERWPQTRKQFRIETAFGWRLGTIEKIRGVGDPGDVYEIRLHRPRGISENTWLLLRRRVEAYFDAEVSAIISQQ